MKIVNAALAYVLMAGVTLGIVNVSSALVYENPSMVVARWFRDDLNE
jgi:hypothetical protein